MGGTFNFYPEKMIRLFFIIALFVGLMPLPCFSDVGPYSDYQTEEYHYAADGNCYKLVYLQSSASGTCSSERETGLLSHTGYIYFPSSIDTECSISSKVRYAYEKWLTYEVPSGYCEGNGDGPLTSVPLEPLEEWLSSYYENNTIDGYPSLLTDLSTGDRINIRGWNFIVWRPNGADETFYYDCTLSKHCIGELNGSATISEWPETRNLKYAFLDRSTNKSTFGDYSSYYYILYAFNNVPYSFTRSDVCQSFSYGWKETWLLIPVGDATFTNHIGFTDFSNPDSLGLEIDLDSVPCGDYVATWTSFSFLKRFDCFVENMQTTDLLSTVSYHIPDINDLGDSTFKIETVNYGSPEFDMSQFDDGLNVLKYCFLIAASWVAIKRFILSGREE